MVSKTKSVKRPFNVSKHQYNPETEGYGNLQDWNAAFRDMTGDEAVVILRTQTRSALQVFGLDVLPETLRDLQLAYHQVMKRVHPDVGGTHEDAILAQAAYLDLQAQIKRRS
jgi:hypothetical protein